MATVVKFRPRTTATFCGEIEARAYYRLCQFLFDRALAEGDAHEAMAQVEDVLDYPLPAFSDARMRKERDDLVMVMVGLAHHRFVEAERAKEMGE